MAALNGLDDTHDPARRSFVESANDPETEFPIQNLPLGIFSSERDPGPRIGVAIGDYVLDLKRVTATVGKFDPKVRNALREPTLNALFSMGSSVIRDVRRVVADMLDERASGNETRRGASDLLVRIEDCSFQLPTRVANYTDFYAGIYHARAAGALMTPENPLPENYKWVPIGYHGRASSVQIAQSTRRPVGQLRPAGAGQPPTFGPTERLDFELEMGFYIAQGNDLGDPISIFDAPNRIAGFCLLNDWSARDIQRWEMYPLGPFLGKSFATSVSPWIVMADALIPFRSPALTRPEGDPLPLEYLFDPADQVSGGLDIELRVLLSTIRMRESQEAAAEILTSNARYLYWTPAQMVSHHTVNGCNLQPGDLIGTGTISGPSQKELSSMLELTVGGTQPVVLPNGEQRAFIEDGDEITFRGRCHRNGYRAIGFGSCTGIVLPALKSSVDA